MKKVYLVDGTNLLYRAFHAIRAFTTSKGTPTNAVMGILNMRLRLIREEEPDLLIFVFDPRGPTLKHKLRPDYKANRKPTPDELRVQVPYVYEALKALGTPVLVRDGIEADDVIGTLAQRYSDRGDKVTIVTGDKDFCQLVTPAIRLLDTMKNQFTGPDEVMDRMGVEADRVIDFLSLTGDKVDNIPGVPGVGPKGAAQLIAEYGSLEGVLDNADKIKGKRGENVRAHAEHVRGNRPMVTIERDLDLGISDDELSSHPIDRPEAARILRELELGRLLRELELEDVKPGAASKRVESAPESQAQEKSPEDEPTPSSPTLAAASKLPASLVALVRVDSGVPADETAALWQCAAKVEGQVREAAFALGAIPEWVAALLGNPETGVVGHSLKKSYGEWEAFGLTGERIVFDTELAAYLLAPGRREYEVENLAAERAIVYGDAPETDPAEEAQSGAELPLQLESATPVDPDKAPKARLVLELAPVLEEELAEQGMGELNRDLELPLLAALGEMEQTGVKVDREKLSVLSEEYAERLEALETRMFELAGEEFNPRSPKHLSAILFEKLKLPVVRKTATGYSTDAAVLEELSLSHPLPAVVLEHRSFSKLKNSFIDTLPKLVDPADGRIHADFNQTVTATGRLSSANPNLQNIPVRGEQGRRIREAFVAEPGFKLVSADYSQIELRVMAHMSDDKVLQEMFASGRDIHSETAARLFNIGPLGVNSEMRRQAKTVNFGILYGISPFGLARQLGVDMAEAARMIETYFASFPGVRFYIDQLIKEVHETGMCRTLFGRIRQIPDINASNRQRREAAERLAVNTPIQGSAADLIKRAMLDAVDATRREQIEGRLILQVHDELIFEVREEQAERARDIICEAMQNAASLKVELKSEAGIGSDWFAAHGG